MKRKRFTEEQIVKILSEPEAGTPITDLCLTYGCGQSTIFKWKFKYGGMGVSDVQRLKALEEENRRLKQMYAEVSLDNDMLKHVLGKKP